MESRQSMTSLVYHRTRLRRLINWVKSLWPWTGPQTGIPSIDRWQNTIKNTGGLPPVSSGIGEDTTRISRGVFVLSLDKAQLRSLCLDLYFDVDKLEKALIDARTDNQQQTEHSQMLLEKLIDDKLTKAEAIQAAQAPSNLEPVQSRRPSWGKIRQDYETKQRAAFWAQKIADQEAADAAKDALKLEGKGTQ